MPLTDTFIKQTKWSGKPVGDKHSDGGGLYLHITKVGKYWRMAYRYGGKQKTLAFGVYPAVTLAQARKRRDSAKELLAEGLDPGLVKQAEKATRALAGENTFEAVAREYHAIKQSIWSESYSAKWLRLLEKDFFPRWASWLFQTLRLRCCSVCYVEWSSVGQWMLRTHCARMQAKCSATESKLVDASVALHQTFKVRSSLYLSNIWRHCWSPLKWGANASYRRYAGQPVTRGALLLSALLFSVQRIFARWSGLGLTLMQPF